VERDEVRWIDRVTLPPAEGMEVDALVHDITNWLELLHDAADSG
jgi:hypothetical protein